MKTRIFTPSELSLFCQSPVAAWWNELDRRKLFTGETPEPDPLNEILKKEGIRHEDELIKKLQTENFKVKRLRGKQEKSDYQERINAMVHGFDFIHQASFNNGQIRGSADLLKRVDIPSKLGPFSYIPIECKLASHINIKFIIQALCYCDLLTETIGSRPRTFEIYLGGGTFEYFEVDKYWNWYQFKKNEYKAFIRDFDPEKQPEDIPGEHSNWTEFITERLKDKRDLILVHNMLKTQRKKLRAKGILSIDQLATIKPNTKIPGMNPDILERLRQQAAIQVKPRKNKNVPEYIIKSQNISFGLLNLPKPSKGDIWFDLEGARDFVRGTKREYLFGVVYLNENNELTDLYWWAHSDEEEKLSFEKFVDWVENRREKFPDLHIYHYANYEKVAVRDLQQNYLTRMTEIVEWLRNKLLIDLQPIVQNTIILGEESYSIKKVEKLYMNREEDMQSAVESMVAYELWKNSGEPGLPGKLEDGLSPMLEEIRKYNRDDLVSTYKLNQWLLNLKSQLNIEETSSKQEEKKEKAPRAIDIEASTLFDEIPLQQLNNDQESNQAIPANPRGWSWETQKVLASLLGFLVREQDVNYWRYFERLEQSFINPSSLLKDDEVIAEALLNENSEEIEYSFNPEQPIKLEKDVNKPWGLRLYLPNCETTLRVQPNGLDCIKGTIKFKGNKDNLIESLSQGECLIKDEFDFAQSTKNSLLAQAREWVSGENTISQTMIQLLERETLPELIPVNEKIQKDVFNIHRYISDFIYDNDEKLIAIQGPPGTGKTTLSSKIVSELVQKGYRVAITANSHRVIDNLLLKIDTNFKELDINRTIAKCDSHRDNIFLTSNVRTLAPKNINNQVSVMGATTNKFCNRDFNSTFDLLIVDEAGQYSLANLLTIARHSRSIILVGDTQQLAMPTKASHPNDSGQSCLQYLMNGLEVVPTNKGIFLPISWRMAPTINNIVSELFYQGKLKANNKNSGNKIIWNKASIKKDTSIYSDAGVIFVPVRHQDCSLKSEEEAEKIQEIIQLLLSSKYKLGTNKERSITSNDILLIAPFNVQVNYLKRKLQERVRIGTVDNFQGQEAIISIFSLTSSSGDDAPRGLDFLLEPNRLNVAISRAKVLSIIVGSPSLAESICKTTEEAKKINRLTRLMN